jgi:hypothetical protein
VRVVEACRYLTLEFCCVADFRRRDGAAHHDGAGGRHPMMPYGPRQQQRFVRPRVARRDGAWASTQGKVRRLAPSRQPDRGRAATRAPPEERAPGTTRLRGAPRLGAARRSARYLMPGAASRLPARPVNHTTLMPGRATSLPTAARAPNAQQTAHPAPAAYGPCVDAYAA